MLSRIKRTLFPSSAPQPPFVPTTGYGQDGFPLDAWADVRYQSWFDQHKTPEAELEAQRNHTFDIQPLFSIIVPLYKTPKDFLDDMVTSILQQTYPNIELVLVNASPELPDLMENVKEWEAKDSRIKHVILDGNYGITENTNAGIQAATGDFCSFCDHDDWIEPDLFFDYVKAINENPQIDLLYCDEDLVDSDHHHLHPLFKPDYSPEALLSRNYVIHLMTIRKTIIDGMPRPDAQYDGAQDFNMLLYSTEKARAVFHSPKVHYHWRICETSTAAKPEAKPYSRRAARKGIYNHIQRLNLNCSVAYSGIINICNPSFRPHSHALSLVVQSSSATTTRDFLAGVQQTNNLGNVEIIIVGQEAVSIDDMGIQARMVTCPPDMGMFARMNLGAQQATGTYTTFLSDTEIPLTAEPLMQLSGLCSIEGVGIAGPKVLYADYSTHSYGVAVTSQRIMPLYRGYPEAHPGYQCNTRASQNYSAICLAGLTVSAADFQAVGGFDTDYASEVGAADLCQKILRLGKRIACSNAIMIMKDTPIPDQVYLNDQNAPDFPASDVALFDEKWPGVRQGGDPYFSAHLDQASCYFQVQGDNHPPAL